MARNILTAGILSLALAGAGVLSANSPALTKTASAKSTAHEAVTVIAPYTVRETAATPRLTDDGLPVEDISVSRPVSYADLDLAKTADAMRFRHRIRMAAKDVCAELNRRFPPGAFMPTPNSQDCVGTTTRKALLAANRVIDATAS